MGMKIKLAICWFQPEQWDRVKSIYTDSDILGETYEGWRKTANEAISKLQTEGHAPVKIRIDLDEFIIWCAEKEVPVSIKASSEFVGLAMKNKSKPA